MAMFPQRASRLYKTFSMVIVFAFAYLAYIISESNSDYRAQSKQLQKFVFDLELWGAKFDQFCIFNVLELLKGAASCVLMLLIYLSFLNFKDGSHDIQVRLKQIVSNKLEGAYEEELKEYSETELSKLVE